MVTDPQTYTATNKQDLLQYTALQLSTQHIYITIAGWPKFNQLEMVTTFTYKPSLAKIDARNFELSW